jgi:hypothetical protein
MNGRSVVEEDLAVIMEELREDTEELRLGVSKCANHLADVELKGRLKDSNNAHLLIVPRWLDRATKCHYGDQVGTSVGVLGRA